MSRAPFQILVIPYWFRDNGQVEYALFRRAGTEDGYWQPIAGGGEDNESPLDAARREATQEAGVRSDAEYTALHSLAMVPRYHFSGGDWGKDVLVVPEYAFAVRADPSSIRISREHTEHIWLRYSAAAQLVKWDSNRTALWELNQLLTAGTHSEPEASAAPYGSSDFPRRDLGQ